MRGSKLALLVGALLIVGACDSTTTTTEPVMAPGPSLAVTSTGWFDYDFTLGDNCNGELVDFDTRRKHVFNTTFDKAGGVHLGYHRAWVGTGVGQVTGTEYILNFPWQEQFYTRGPFPVTYTRTVNNNLVTKGSADNRVFKVTEHVTINANGETTVDFLDIMLKCVG